MNRREILSRFISRCSCHSPGFAIWSMPGDEKIQAIVQQSGALQNVANFKNFGTIKGFVFSPFMSDDICNTIVLSPEKFLIGFEEIKKFTVSIPDKQFSLPEKFSAKYISTSKDEYLNGCNWIIDRIKNNEAQKVVYSRVKVVTNPQKKTSADLLLGLMEKYPSAFCYLFHTPTTGTWMGASPEIFICQSNKSIQTMALAGTRPHIAKTSIANDWPQKERIEQQFVTDYIKNKLTEVGADVFAVSEPYTSRAGDIEHICSDFTIEPNSDKNLFGKIVEALHPTPAICGVPKDVAIRIIAQTEKHNREFYTGFLGSVNLENKSTLFVNLRCMKVFTDKFVLFTGGGITAGSNAEAEWLETEMKANILAQVIEQV